MVTSIKLSSDRVSKVSKKGTKKSSQCQIEDKKVKVEQDVKSTADQEGDNPGLLQMQNKPGRSSLLEQIMFKLPVVKVPLSGTPQETRKELDALAKRIQKHPDDNDSFNKIHLYMHGYLVNVVLKKFPFIKGYQTVDIYQETLIALRFKAIPGFKDNKGMSFLNFAKMCIRRHLITLLNTSIQRKRDRSMNQAISLDSTPASNSQDETCTLFNIISDNKDAVDVAYEKTEAYDVTLKTLLQTLSSFEKIVLNEYLNSSSYKEISKNISVILKRRFNAKSIDNALLRIRKKATQLFKVNKKESLPLFIHK